MNHYIDLDSGDVLGFEEQITPDELIMAGAVQLTEAQFQDYQHQPSKYHTFSPKTLSWEISDSDNEKWERDLRTQEVLLASVEYEKVIADIQTLNRMVQVGRSTPAHEEQLQLLEARSFDLYEIINDLR